MGYFSLAVHRWKTKATVFHLNRLLLIREQQRKEIQLGLALRDVEIKNLLTAISARPKGSVVKF